METYVWYQQLIRPDWAPPAWVFGPVWSVLYLLIFISFGAVLLKVFQKKLPAKIALPFVLNIVFNLAFTPIQFGLQNNILAALDILFVLGTMVWMFKFIWPHMRWVIYVNIPYFLWVSFATILQLTITYLNL
ncbi:MAG: tryptophan-rich sensory protein [Candidatus Colwellbacteria bacterium CG10_big_fil_rev_8_21_14_0_10_42_22]|uniref:Tryptophan-rich sensory protein n=1 Tax=Candidatus Colwellbacteria bacterium CG10_big_fil_rev_8_21_14_0_10_42_22 TaxID=1974540 RepID=A0A2H0VFP8_9BACT|nr:MAG: tryptophan-rich sensory protein [Candidatus Colwellbacteria bacterium CG10_big_fil_rev_8_21_14_0_10_42_22]